MNTTPELLDESTPTARRTRGAAAAVEHEGATTAAAILSTGGNAADAAIAGAVVQTVVDPFKSSIGGCGHFLYRLRGTR